MIGWGTAIGFSRLLALAEHVAPGISFPWAAWQAFSTLSEAARGNLLRALQTLPLSALATTDLHDALGQTLHVLFPSGFGTATGHQDVVIGLACCAVLYEMTRQQPVEIARSAGGRALLHRLRQLRAALNVVAGLQRIHNGGPGRSDDVGVPSASGALHSYAVGRRPVENGWSGKADPVLSMASLPGSASETAAPGTWLLPGAVARSGKGNAAPPKKPPPKPGPKPGQGARKSSLAKPSSPRHRGHPAKGVVAGVGAGGGVDHGGAAGTAAVSSSGSGGGAGEVNKEAMVSVLPAKKVDKDLTSPVRTDKAPDRPPELPAGTPQTGKDPAIHAVVEPPARAASPASPARLSPSCVQFHHVGEAGRQVRKARFDVPMPIFCVHDRARPLFESQFNVATDPRTHAEEWIVAWPVRERYARMLQQAGIRKYSGLGQLHRQVPRDAVPLGEDALYVVATISLLPDHILQHHAVNQTQVLAPNGFRLVEHIQLDGHRRLFMAYVIQHCKGAEPGIRAGFMEIEQRPDGFRMEDAESGFMFHSDGLASLVIGIERVSGWRFRPDVSTLRRIGAQASAPVVVPAASSLFVRLEDLPADTTCLGTNRLNSRAHFFEPVAFEEPGAGRRSLLRSCFTFMDDMIVVVDAEGMLRTLVFTPGDAGSDVRTLNAQRGPENEFLRTLGLQAGEAYALQGVIGELQSRGFTRVPAEVASRFAPLQGEAGFRVYRSEGGPGQGPDLPAESGEAIDHPVLSTFHIGDDRIHYVDHDATVGVLLLNCDGPPPRNWMLAAGNSPPALLFARSNGIQPGEHYAMGELTWLLYGNGFVQLAGPAATRR